MAESLQHGGYRAPVRLAAVHPNNADQPRQKPEHGNVTQFDLSDHFGEIRQSSQQQNRIRVAQVIDDDQRRCVAGIIFQPSDRHPSTGEDDNPAKEFKNTPEETSARGQNRQVGQTRAPNFANGFRGGWH